MNGDLDARVRQAVRFFWASRRRQADRQARAGKKDQGARGAVTGGGQLDGFINLVTDLLTENGVPTTAIHRKRRVDLPGFFRPTKEWDLVVVHEGMLVAAVEFKSHVGPSFGNNFNNRTEEAIGGATDLWTAFREGAFGNNAAPWLGYFLLLERAAGSTRPVRVNEPHFPVFPEFRDTSYARRYELLCAKLLRERLYSSVCLILSEAQAGRRGEYVEPAREIGFQRFTNSLLAAVGPFTAPRVGKRKTRLQTGR